MRNSPVHPDLLGAVKGHILATGERNSTDIADAVRARFRERAEAGDAVARFLEEAWAREGCRLQCKAALDLCERERTVKVSGGKIVGLPATVGVPERDPETGKRTGRFVRQGLLIEEFSWAQFDAALGTRAGQHAVLGAKILGFREIGRLREVPGCEDTFGPFEACVRLGLDPFALDLAALVNE